MRKVGDALAESASTLPGADALLASLWRPRPGSMTDQVLGAVGAAADLSLVLARLVGARPIGRGALDKAGNVMRRAREAAGLTVAQVGEAIDLEDPALLELAEHGRAALPVEVLLRLAAVLARNDPVPFLMQVARNYSPQLWRTLGQLGVDRLVLHAGREHEFINIYRSRDSARRLSDAEFAQVLAFTESAFTMALRLVDETRPRRRRSGPG